jgi:thiol-disulfide isomerase/thioredoxin
VSLLGKLGLEGRLPGFSGATGWLNSEPLSVERLRGKVVLVDFWTYTCINWLRTLSYIRAWADKYEDHGLIVVGVHTPEFPFERETGNVREAAHDMIVEYPIALDPDYEVWTAFGNRYWPAAYFADADGRIRHHQFGEGGYDECERVIQRLLREAGREGASEELVSASGEGLEAQADWTNLESPETYLGYQQGHNFASPGGVVADASHTYVMPDGLRLNSWALSGDWTIQSRASVLDEAGGAIAFRFHARDVNLVLRSPTGDAVPFRILLDGAVPGASHGVDADSKGDGTLIQPRLYQLVRQHGAIVDRTFEITFLAPGLEAYVFTFG